MTLFLEVLWPALQGEHIFAKRTPQQKSTLNIVIPSNVTELVFFICVPVHLYVYIKRKLVFARKCRNFCTWRGMIAPKSRLLTQTSKSQPKLPTRVRPLRQFLDLGPGPRSLYPPKPKNDWSIRTACIYADRQPYINIICAVWPKGALGVCLACFRT